MRHLNLDQLHALTEVVDLGSFSAAARRLNLTQPAVSLQIRELEARLKTPLVKRVGKRAYATPAGDELIEYARGIFDTTNRALAAMRRHKDGRIGRVHVGSGMAALSYILLPTLTRLRADHPNIELAVTTGNTDYVTECMIRNTIDLGFISLPVDERVFEAKVVRDMPMVAILSRNDDKAPPVMAPQDIASRPLIVTLQRSNHSQMTLEWLEKAGLNVRPAMEIDCVETVKRVVAGGFGVAVIPEEAMSAGPRVDGIVARPLDPPLISTLALVRKRTTPDDPALKIVEDAILTLRVSEGGAIAAASLAHHLDR